ncbi:unnamed protein product [Linum trigynum]|uniref:Uncharacterized protein n=1 Tax=Linum trigynum TaxID=586398 RepID=A0AAV2F6T6_9ROSI
MAPSPPPIESRAGSSVSGNRLGPLAGGDLRFRREASRSVPRSSNRSLGGSCVGGHWWSRCAGRFSSLLLEIGMG